MKCEFLSYHRAAFFALVLVVVYPETAQALDSAEQALQLQEVLKETVDRSEAVTRLALLVFGGSVAAQSPGSVLAL